MHRLGLCDGTDGGTLWLFRSPKSPQDMKPRVVALAVLVVAAFVVMPNRLWSAETPGASKGPIVAEFVESDDPKIAEIRALGERAINRLAITLVNEVAVASKKGPENAVEVCHLKALPLTGEVVAGMPRITAAKRTSLRLRNPANAPDEAELLALRSVERDIERGKAPAQLLLQKVTQPGGGTEWRVYRPLGLLGHCVACHGPRENQTPELQAKLKQLYPNDQAVGYAPGQWRGLMRVTVSDTPAPAKAPPKAPAPKARKA